jgi:hypothetical protein
VGEGCGLSVGLGAGVGNGVSGSVGTSATWLGVVANGLDSVADAARGARAG